LPDQQLDAVWSVNLDTLLMNTFPGASFKLYGSRNSFINYYSGKCKVHELPTHGEFSASGIRDSIKEQVMDSMEFRAGIIYAYANTYPKVYPTVDVAVFRNDKKEILLGKKDNDQKWRLIGGFTDPTDEGFESAAMRELQEECGDISVTSMEYEGSFRVDDWRYRNETDKIVTTLFSTDFVSGEPKVNDDIAEVKWFPISDLPEMISSGLTTITHNTLFNTLLIKYLK
jgi:bifunctional NMN adenylyltransferase/nudix hydrolase